jgi:hypothetical protein
MQINNSKQRKTLGKIYTHPIPNDIPWTRIISLCSHIGCTIEYGKGSKVTIKKDAAKIFCHSPHPNKETPESTVAAIKEFLEQLEVTL